MPSETKKRIQYFPLGEATPGMVLGAALVLQEHGVVRFNLPAGHVLTEANLDQLRTRHAEFVCIVTEDTRTLEQREAEYFREAKRIERIFQLADLKQPHVRNLYLNVLAYRGS